MHFFSMGCSLTLLVISLLHNTVLAEWRQEGSCNVSSTSNKGAEFILTVAPLLNSPPSAELFATSLQNVSIDVDSTTLDFKQISSVNNVATKIVLASNLPRHQGIGIRDGAFIVRSSSVISLYGLRDKGGASLEGFTAIPVEALSTTYVVASYKLGGFVPYRENIKSQVRVVGIHNHTSVSIRLNISSNLMLEGKSYRYGDTINVVLNTLQTFVIEHNEDLSGTIISGDRQIAVFSGALLEIPDGVFDIDQTLSQLIPLEHWDTNFVVPPLYPREDSILRIYAFHPNTSISFGNETCRTTSVLKTGGFIEHVIGVEIVTINSSKPISVTQYAYSRYHGSGVIDGGPLMMVIPGLHQFSSEYIFPTMTSSTDVRHFVSIIIKFNSVFGLRMDGHTLAGTTSSVRVNGDDYIVINTEVTNSVHSLTHLDANVKFGALVYGFGSGMGYGFPAGMEFTKSVSCDTTQNSVPTTVMTVKDFDLVCFSCTAVTHLKYCDLVEKCTTNLGCFVEQYQIGNHVRYNTGCVTHHVASCGQNHNVSGRCSSCCSTSYCNGHGCGDDGFRSSDLRGPLCYDCHNLDDPSECINILQCAQDEMCFIEEHLWGDSEKVFSMGCRPKYHCPFLTNALNPDHAVFRRAVFTCSICCHGDFCNTNCTMPQSTPIIG